MMFNLRRSKREEWIKTTTSGADGTLVLNGGAKMKTSKKSCLRQSADGSSIASSSGSSRSIGSSSKFSSTSLDDDTSTMSGVSSSAKPLRNPADESVKSSSSLPLPAESRSSSDTSSHRPSSKAVRFNKIHIRDYERDIGDNPSCSSGPPVGYVFSKLFTSRFTE